MEQWSLLRIDTVARSLSSGNVVFSWGAPSVTAAGAKALPDALDFGLAPGLCFFTGHQAPGTQASCLSRHLLRVGD